jgi:rod shape-determining protein MreC
MASPRNNVKNIIVIAIIVVLCIVIITASFRDASVIKVIKAKTFDIFRPVQEKLFIVFRPVVKTINNIKNFFGLPSKLKQLESENAKLLKDYSENINLKIENNSLRDLLDLKQRKDYEAVVAKVIGYSNKEWQSEVILNVGKNNGVLEGMGVVNEKGLIGIVVLSASSTCEVRLINDPQTSVGARILSSRSLGMIEGSQSKKLFLNYISKDDLVFPGDIIITAGSARYIPPEILIGSVRKVSSNQTTPFMTIEVEPFVDFKSIENVLVITGW